MENRVIELCPVSRGGDITCGECSLSISVSQGNLICSVSGEPVYTRTKCTEGEPHESFIDSQETVKELRKEIERLEEQVESLTSERDELITERDALITERDEISTKNEF